MLKGGCVPSACVPLSAGHRARPARGFLQCNCAPNSKNHSFRLCFQKCYRLDIRDKNGFGHRLSRSFMLVLDTSEAPASARYQMLEDSWSSCKVRLAPETEHQYRTALVDHNEGKSSINWMDVASYFLQDTWLLQNRIGFPKSSTYHCLCTCVELRLLWLPVFVNNSNALVWTCWRPYISFSFVHVVSFLASDECGLVRWLRGVLEKESNLVDDTDIWVIQQSWK